MADCRFDVGASACAGAAIISTVEIRIEGVEVSVTNLV